MLYTKHYLVNIPDSSVRQTLDIMTNTNVRPKTLEVIANGKFFNINGQHNIVANKDMQTLGLLENIIKHLKE